MAENTQIISGYIVRPNGDPFTEGVVRFTLGRPDTDEDEVIAAGKYVEFDIASDGSFAAELWPNTRGNVGGAYIVQVREAERTPFETIGRVQVQDAGPYDLAALLRADIPQAQNTFYSVLSQDEYDAFVAEMDAKVAEAQGYAESYDVAAISAAVTATGEDAAATAADRVATGNDATATAADRVATGEDATATAADRVATGEDVIAAAGSAQAASDAAAAVPDIKTFDTYAESVTYGGSNPAALIFCKEPMILFKGPSVFWNIYGNFFPGELFSSGESGAWYDPSDLSTLWQDTAGTVPVTAAGQSVARMDDKSGNGNHAIQATAAARPAYQTDGTLHWLAFDGVDDMLATATAITAGTDEAQIFAGVRRLSDNIAIILETSTSSANTNGTVGFFYNTAFGHSFSNRGSNRVITSKSSPAAPLSYVLSGQGNLPGDSSILRVNGNETTLGDDLGATPYANHRLYIGRRSNGDTPLNGNVYGAVIRFGPSLSTSQLNGVEEYIAEKTGVTL